MELTELLGLSGAVKSAEFLSLCDNLDPRTGESLTVRQKTTRRETDANGGAREVANSSAPTKNVDVTEELPHAGNQSKGNPLCVGCISSQLGMQRPVFPFGSYQD